jgi:serine/threonine protein kinase
LLPTQQVGIYKALLDTASGLDYLHSIGVVHGDLKTANVLLKGSAKDPRGFMCKITDFGLSRVLDLDATHISTATYGEWYGKGCDLLNQT